MNRRRRSIVDNDPFAERAPVRAFWVSVSGRGAKSRVGKPLGPDDGGTEGDGGDDAVACDAAPPCDSPSVPGGSLGGSGGGCARLERNRWREALVRMRGCR